MRDRRSSKAEAVPLREREVQTRGGNSEWNILVVGSDEDAADLSSAVLKREAYSVRTAYSGGQALKYLKASPADLVLTELVMPRMDGMQLLAHVREMYPDTDVIVLTGQATIGGAVEALHRGAADFLPKPFSPRDLKRLVSSSLRAKRANRDRTFLTQSTSLVQLAQVLASSADASAFPRRAVDLARENFDADAAVLLSCESSGGPLSILAHSGSVLSGWGRSEKFTEQGLLAIRQRNVVLSAEVDSGDCYAYVPLIVSNRPRGALCLRRVGGPWFHEKSIELLEIFAAHLALSLESVYLHETASQKVYELEDIITGRQSFSLNADLERAAGQLLEGVGRLIRAEICAILLTTGGKEVFRTAPVVSAGSPLHLAIRSKLSGVLNRPDGAAKALPLSSETGPPFASFVCAPLAIGQSRYGVVAAFSSKPECFSAEDARKLATLAVQAVAAMENASKLELVSSMYRETIEMIANLVDARYAYSYGHSRQVRTYAGELARVLGLPCEDVFRIEDGALLHDIGKLCVPATVLNKATPLTPDEFEIVTSHPVYGATMFRNAPHLSDLVPVVRYHHERYDGKGYPDGLKAEEIPLSARLVAVCDVFDALISHRIYRPALDFKEARSIVADGAGKQFDPELTALFLSLPLEKLVEH